MYHPPSPVVPSLPGRRVAKEPQSQGFFLLGVFTTIATFVVVVAMFTSRAVISEEEEIIGSVTATMKTAQKEWLTPEVMGDMVSLTVGEQDLALALYRLRVIVLADVDTPKIQGRLAVFLTTLVDANYTGRAFPVDVEVRLTGIQNSGDGEPATRQSHVAELLQTLAEVSWRHGRFSVETKTAVGSPVDLWLPMSDWEVAVFIDVSHGEHTPLLSPAWFAWLQQALRQYGTGTGGGFHPLGGREGAGLRAGVDPLRMERSAVVGLALNGEAGGDSPVERVAAAGTTWYEPQKSGLGRCLMPSSLLGISLDIPYSGAAPPQSEAYASRAHAAHDLAGGAYAKWVSMQELHGPALLIQRPGTVVTAFFARAWRYWCRTEGLRGHGRENFPNDMRAASRLPWHRVEFVRWMERAGVAVLFPHRPDGLSLVSDRASIPSLKTSKDGEAPVVLPGYFELDAFDGNLTRLPQGYFADRGGAVML